MIQIIWIICAGVNLFLVLKYWKKYTFPWKILLPIYAVYIGPIWTLGWLILKYGEKYDD